MAPEMITNGQHNHTLDVWSLGILLYEMLHGHAPFRGNNYNVMHERIFHAKIRFKKSLPEDARDLIKMLLQREANDRIPLIKVFTHPWVIRLQEKHSLSRENSVNLQSQKIKESFVEEEKALPLKMVHKKPKPEFGYYNKNEHKYQEEINDFAVKPEQLEKELRKFDAMEHKKEIIMKEKKNKKFGNIFKQSPDKNENNEEFHNLLDLSGFEDPKNKSAF